MIFSFRDRTKSSERKKHRHFSRGQWQSTPWYYIYHFTSMVSGHWQSLCFKAAEAINYATCKHATQGHRVRKKSLKRSSHEIFSTAGLFYAINPAWRHFIWCLAVADSRVWKKVVNVQLQYSGLHAERKKSGNKIIFLDMSFKISSLPPMYLMCKILIHEK